MSTVHRPSFQQCALASGLLTEQEIQAALTAVGWSAGDEPDAQAPPSDQQLADRLVAMSKLNVWQARQLLDGRTKFTLGPYRIVDSIGQGGMGHVFKAEHGVMGRVVAIKVLPQSKTTPEAVGSFLREIRAMASLDHPRLVRALDTGYDGNVYYLVTEYVPGLDLRKLIRRDGPMDTERAADIAYQVADGLAHAHAQGLIHRDVKPANVLVTPQGEAKLSDLGLSGPLDGDVESDPRFGKIVGTADYVSPDHLRCPWNPTPAWDVYSLGCTLYYAATGKVPFPGGTMADKARAHCELRPLDPRRLNRRLSDALVDVIADMMAKNPAERIQSAAEVMVRLAPLAGRPRPVVSATNGRAHAKRPGSPLVAAPPVVGTSTASGRPAQTRVDDTQDDLPAMAGSERKRKTQVRPGDSAGSGGDWTGTELLPRPMQTEPCGDCPSIFRPLATLILVPLLLVGFVVLGWWLTH